MKKLSLTALALTLALASCNKENLETSVQGAEVMVSFSATLPENVATKAYSDGHKATKLQYWVYDGDSSSSYPKMLANGTAEFAAGQLTTNVTISLVSGKKYSIAFWADHFGGENTPYSYSTFSRTITVNYNNALAQDDDRDAFFAYEQPFQVTGPMTRDVVLKRPFSQINVGTSDYETAKALGYELKQTALSVKGVYRSLKLYDGTASSPVEQVSFALADIPAEEELFPFQPETYKYVSMAYVLVGAEREIVDVAMTTDLATKPELTFTQVPVQRNYRTNIYGSMLLDEVTYSVRIDPEYDGIFSTEAWNGEDKTEVAPVPGDDPDVANVYEITTPAELAWLADYVNAGNSLAGATVRLLSDLDLGNSPWTPIGTATAQFDGVFDGNNHTISNLTIKGLADGAQAGLFGSLRNATVKDMKITNVDIENLKGTRTGVVSGHAIPDALISNVEVSNATILANRQSGGIIGASYGSVENCKVTDIEITAIPDAVGTNEDGSVKYDNGDKVGGIAGYLCESNYHLNGNTVKNIKIRGYRDLGGIAGASASNVYENTLENAEITVDQTTNFYGAEKINANEIVGRNLTTADKIHDNIFSNVTITEIWDGVNATPVAEVNNVYSIRFASQLAWIEQEVNAGTSTFANKTVELLQDIDLQNVAWTPIGKANDAKKFKGTLNGNGKTISNLNVNNSTRSQYAGLFGVLNGTVRDLVIEHAAIVNTASSSATGVLMGSAFNWAVVDNVTIRNCEVKGTQFTGGVTGSAYANIANTTVEDCVISATSQDNGGIAGYLCEGGNLIDHCVVRNVTINGGFQDVGGIVGSTYSPLKNNLAENVRIYVTSLSNKGEIAGRFLAENLNENNVADNVQIIVK